MKKVSAILIALLIAATTMITAFAADVNDSEKAVLDELKQSVTMQGKEMVWPDAYVNQAENYFNTIDLTADQADQAIAIIKEGKKFVESTGAANIPDMTVAQKQEMMSFLTRITAVFGGTASYDRTTREASIYDPDGKVLLRVVPVFVEKETGKAVDKDGNPVDSGVIKTTGASADFTPVIIIGAVSALIIAGGVFFVVKKRRV